MNTLDFIAFIILLAWVSLAALGWYFIHYLRPARSYAALLADFHREVSSCLMALSSQAEPLEMVDVVQVRDGAKVPERAHPGDAGADLFAWLKDEPGGSIVLRPGAKAMVGTGVAVDTPPGYVSLIHPRSGLAGKFHVSIVNAPGTVDAGYQGELKVILENRGTEPVEFSHGDKIAQLVVQRVELPGFRVVDGFDAASDRGAGGFGSTGF